MRAWLLIGAAVGVAGLCGLPAAPAAAQTVAQAAPRSAAKPAAARADAQKDTRVWLLAKADDTFVLRFGPPRVADPVFAVSCQPGARLLQFTVEAMSSRIRSGDGVALSLHAGKRRLELAASAFRGAGEGRVVVEAAVSLEDRVLDIFADGETLVVRMPGASESYPLAGAKTKLPDFRRACLGAR